MNSFFSNLNDVELLARLIYGEARGEGVQGMLAVAQVAMNRAARPGWWGSNLKEVILHPYQFSCFNDAYSAALINPSDDSWEDCKKIAVIVLGGVADPTFGATHYFADYIDPPNWAAGMTHTATIGRHLFYK